MDQKGNIHELSLLMNENTLSEADKKEITRKINKLLEIFNYLSELKNVDASLANEINELRTALLAEQKTTAKLVVLKNNCLAKNLIKSLTIQKENSLQVIEINQLNLEAELKKLKAEACPAIKNNNSLFNKLFKLLKIPFNIKSSNTLQAKIDSTTSKLNNLEKQKENLSKDFGANGKEALKYLNKVTYDSLIPIWDLSSKDIMSIKNKITFINN